MTLFKSYKWILPFVGTTIVATVISGLFSIYFLFQYSMTVENNIYQHIDEYGEIDLHHLCIMSSCKGMFYDNKYYSFDKHTHVLEFKYSKDVNLSKEILRNGNISLRQNLSFIVPVSPEGFDITAYFEINISRFIPNFFTLYIVFLIIMYVSAGIIINMVLAKEKMLSDIELAKDKTALQFDNLMFYIENLNHEVNSPLFILSRKLKDLEKKVNGENKTFEIIFNSIEQISAVMHRTREVKKINKVSEDRTIYDLIESTILTIDVMRSENISSITDKQLNRYYLNQDLLSNGMFINILTNHIKNSIEAYADTITSNFVSINKNKTKIVFSFLDNGNGIPEIIKNRVFEKGFSTKGDKLVRGSGMSINKYIIESVGGFIKINDVESGTELEISIPIKKERE